MKVKILLLITIICVLFLYPFFMSGYFKTDDGEWAIIRLAEMKREVSDLQFPPRWADFLNHGYGYPLFLFTYPLPYYLGIPLLLAGFDLTTSIKAIFILSTFFGALGMYFFSKRYFNEFGGFISSIFYITAPYKLLNLYTRGSIGETLTLGLVPWLFLSFDEIESSNKAKFFSVILLSALVISHNVGGLLFSGFLIVYFIASNLKNLKKLKLGIIAFIFGLLLSAYFWLPLFVEKAYIFAGNNPIANRFQHFISFKDLIFQNIQYDVVPPIFIGYMHLFVLLLAVFVFFYVKKYKYRYILLFFLGITLVSIFLITEISNIFWSLPFISLVDFPWRLMLVISFATSFLAGTINLLPKGKYIIAIVIPVALLLYFPQVRVTDRIFYPDNYYLTNDATTTSKDELMPIWVDVKPRVKWEKKVIAEGTVDNLIFNSKEIAFNIESPFLQMITINSIYFPGWEFKVNGINTPAQISKPLGLIQIPINQGLNKINGQFTQTPIRKVADVISILSFVIFISFYLLKYKKIKTK